MTDLLLVAATFGAALGGAFLGACCGIYIGVRAVLYTLKREDEDGGTADA